MNWKIETVDDGYRLYLEGFYPLPDHCHQIWWPIRKSETDYIFQTLNDVIKRMEDGASISLISAREKYLEAPSD